jgi:hypothetical protein
MNGELTATMDAVDEKLREARLEIGRLSELLAARELELSDTRIALSRFEGLY